ncbi:1-phosphofructokinase family hexose kinase [Listeria seeligeri]|uniref:1-phosphofructokinase n=1 Tax=Listeria seeligeri TaxID=1640 RepID=UPI0016277E1D|nr:1-phosphofructokinase family hexose kinase [Listeria seeligeri]MBC1831973.1 1-phosphofructokinase family hexose kinase [Listeria seeligeri]MBC1867679.1 1-phosphofructokinase family hexose kinase [Listeria seeligeri]MBC1876111.1 1-phosphofructokinase family hexose kinase [Listeria seeligeri]MBC1900115.1 1-phosphofructokinase family hexose kinase [Listeria seeligeri]MBC6130604.1 1-phosphofructokinase family hexose kinase [Listeria seeligeri]
MIYTITLNPAIDRLLFINGELEKRKTNRVIKTAFDCGGKGLHVSGVLSKFGIKNEALGIAGSNNLDQLYTILEEKHINHDFLVEAGTSTRECFVVLSDDTNGSTMIPEAGFSVSQTNKTNLLKQIAKKVKKEDMVVIAGSPPPHYTLSDFKELLETVKNTGAFLACDSSGDYLKLAVQLGVDFIKPNEEEVVAILAEKTESLEENIRSLALKIPYLVVSLGGKGSICAHNGKLYQAIPPVVKERNDTGAGDVFVGAFIAGMAMNMPIMETLKVATGCSASKVMQLDSSSFDLEAAGQLKNQVSIIQLEER